MKIKKSLAILSHDLSSISELHAKSNKVWVGRQNQFKKKRKTTPKNLKSAIQMLLEIEIKGREE